MIKGGFVVANVQNRPISRVARIKDNHVYVECPDCGEDAWTGMSFNGPSNIKMDVNGLLAECAFCGTKSAFNGIIDFRGRA